MGMTSDLTIPLRLYISGTMRSTRIDNLRDNLAGFAIPGMGILFRGLVTGDALERECLAAVAGLGYLRPHILEGQRGQVDCFSSSPAFVAAWPATLPSKLQPLLSAIQRDFAISCYYVTRERNRVFRTPDRLPSLPIGRTIAIEPGDDNISFSDSDLSIS